MNLRQLDVLRRRRRRGLVHACRARDRHRAAVALAAHPRARGGAGRRLLERLPRGIALTPAGRTLLPEARAAVRAVERGRRGARAALALEAGELEIATVLSMAVGLLPRYIRALARALPGRRHPPARVPAPLAARGRRRAGRRRLRDRPAAGASVGGPARAVISWEEFVVVVAAERPARRRAARSGSKSSPTASGCSTTRTTGSPGSSRRSAAAPGSARAGSVRTSQAEGAARLASAGLGPALVPDNIVLPGIEGSVLRLEPRLIREVAAYARTEWSPTAAAFVDVLRTEQRPQAARRASSIRL